MREQRTGVKEFRPVDLLPLVGRRPGCVRLRRQRVCWRAQTEYVEKKGLAVALPPIANESTLRLPAVRDRRAIVEHPLPVGALVQLFREQTDLTFLRCVPC